MFVDCPVCHQFLGALDALVDARVCLSSSCWSPAGNGDSPRPALQSVLVWLFRSTAPMEQGICHRMFLTAGHLHLTGGLICDIPRPLWFHSLALPVSCVAALMLGVHSVDPLVVATLGELSNRIRAATTASPNTSFWPDRSSSNSL